MSCTPRNVGFRPPLPVGEQLHRQEELPILLPLPPVSDGSHHGRVWLWPALYPLPPPEHRSLARHCHVSFQDLSHVFVSYPFQIAEFSYSVQVASWLQQVFMTVAEYNVLRQVMPFTVVNRLVSQIFGSTLLYPDGPGAA